MAEHDPEAFKDLFDSEPDQPSPQEVAEWVDRYTRLVDLLDRQLDETRRLSASLPDALKQYLNRENLKILVEELEVFRDRLAHWEALG